jgi:hypothetical protein
VKHVFEEKSSDTKTADESQQVKTTTTRSNAKARASRNEAKPAQEDHALRKPRSGICVLYCNALHCIALSVQFLRRAAGNWQLEAGSWELGVGSWSWELEAWNWKLQLGAGMCSLRAGFWELEAEISKLGNRITLTTNPERT